MTAQWSPEVADLVARAIRDGSTVAGAWDEQPPDIQAMYQRGAATVLGALFGAGTDYRVELVADDGWTEAKPGQTPGGLVPGEGDVPHPLHLGALRAAVRLTTVRDMECIILRRDHAAGVLAYVDELRREVAVLAETNRRMNEGWANAEAAVQAETRKWATDALRDRERWAKWCAERIAWEGRQTIDVRQPTDAADYLAAQPDHSGGYDLGHDAPPPNDIEATGHCCCNGCVGEGPCDLDPRPDLSELDNFCDEDEEVDRG